MFRPKLLTTLKGYTPAQFFSDLIAGIIVGVVALPLAIAFAIASGVTPQQGLVTAILAGFLISALGGSRVQIGGPTGAFVVILYDIVQQYGMNGLMIATFMAGCILIVMGFARLGKVIKFIPYPVTVGFTSGIAVLIFSSQLKDFFGLHIHNFPAEFLGKWVEIYKHMDTFNPLSFLIALVCVLIIVYWPKISKRIPGSLIAILISTIVVSLLKLPVETIGSHYGEISGFLAIPTFPSVDWQTIQNLVRPAIAIALLASIEALLSAVVADGMIGSKHRSNTELIAQGIANIICPIFGGIPATGAIARTAINIKNGGRTPVAGIVHAVTLFLIVLFFKHWASMIPMACLAAILVVVSYNMSEWRTFRALLRSPRSDVLVLFTTFGLTVLVDLTVAIEVGMIAAALLFMRRMAQLTNVKSITQDMQNRVSKKDDPMAIDKKIVPEGVEVFEVSGPLFFGAAYKFEEAMADFHEKQKVLIIRIRNVSTIDSTALHVLEQVHKNCQKKNIAFIVSGVHTQPLAAMEESGLMDKIGRENLHPDIDLALNRAHEILGLDPLTKSTLIHLNSIDFKVLTSRASHEELPFKKI